MKNLQVILASAFLATGFLGTLKAQNKLVKKLDEKRSFWQISARAGYDFPMYKESFPFIDYKDGFMGGVSVNKYWNWVGIEADADFIKNTPEAVNLAGQYVDYKLQKTIFVTTLLSMFKRKTFQEHLLAPGRPLNGKVITINLLQNLV